jgi:hypothetical protein
MRSFLISILTTLATVALITAWVGPARDAMIERPAPEDLGLRNPPRVRQKLTNRKPTLVLMGNSVMDAAVDEPAFQRAIGFKTLGVTFHGSASALWFLLTKNVVVTNEPPPKVLVLGFRDTFLTEPDYRTGSRYTRTLNFFSGPEEPALDRKAYLRDTSALERFALRHWSMWQQRDELRESTEQWFKGELAAPLVDLDRDGIADAVDRVFDESRKTPAAVDAAQRAAEIVIEPYHFDFDAQLGQSFLPEMIRLTRDAGTRLILVRLPNRRTAEALVIPDLDQPFPPEWLPPYMQDLKAYLEAEGVPMLDFEGDPRIPFAWYARGDHLGEEPGQAEFTKMLVEALEPHVADLR